MERPVLVMRELVDNALNAQATQVSVRRLGWRCAIDLSKKQGQQYLA